MSIFNISQNNQLFLKKRNFKQTMDRNYHKRLTNYLSQPKTGLYRQSSQPSYLAAVKAKYINKPSQINHYINPSPYNNIRADDRGFFCQQCELERNRNRYACNHRTQYDRGLQNNKIEETLVKSEYFAPQIKTIRNTLLDIRDQMKQRTSKNQRNQQNNNNQKYNQTFTKNIQPNYLINNQQQKVIKIKLQQKNRLVNQLQLKIDQLQRFIQDLKRKNKQLEEDITIFQNKSIQYQKQIQQQRSRANWIQSQKNKTQQRERMLQIKIMDLRAELMKNQQMLRELNLNEQQNRQIEAIKRFGMKPSEQISMMVSGVGYKQSRGFQTHLTQVDIQSGYKELNKMQDTLCDKINGNLKVEKKIFARIQQIEDKLRFAYDKIYQVKQEAFKMGINIGTINF